MNELLFFGQVALVFAFTGWLARFGKETLSGWMGLLGVLANLFVSKQITLWGLQVTASDVFAVGLFLSLNILQEFWGKTEGSRAIRVTLLFQIFFLLLSQIHLAFTPNEFDASQGAFKVVLGTYPRVLAASLVTLWVTQRWDLWFFGALKNYLPKLSFSFRNMITLFLSQVLDTVLFTLLALSGTAGNLMDIMLFSFIVKAILIAATPLITTPLKRYAIPF